jgi:hypothetical protein
MPIERGIAADGSRRSSASAYSPIDRYLMPKAFRPGSVADQLISTDGQLTDGRQSGGLGLSMPGTAAGCVMSPGIFISTALIRLRGSTSMAAPPL